MMDWTAREWAIFIRVMTFVFFLVIIAQLAWTQWQFGRQLRQLQRQWALDRQHAIDEVKRTADRLTEETLRIAEAVKVETMNRATVTAEDLSAKISELTEQFDTVGRQQRSIRHTVEKTHDAVQQIAKDTSTTANDHG